MSVTYSQKNESTQKTSENAAASVLDYSTQSEGLQRKADMMHSRPIKSIYNSVAQMEKERATIKFEKNRANEWHRNMEIIESTSPYVFVHTSRNAKDTETNPIPVNNAAIVKSRNTGLFHLTNQVSINREKNKFQSNEEVNSHITLEGRYIRALLNIASNSSTSLKGLKKGSPVDANYDNLNFKFQSLIPDGDALKSEKSIIQWINETAAKAKNNVYKNSKFAESKKHPIELKNDAIDLIGKVEFRTASYANDLIKNLKAQAQDHAQERIVHYGGNPWGDPWTIPQAD